VVVNWHESLPKEGPNASKPTIGLNGHFRFATDARASERWGRKGRRRREQRHRKVTLLRALPYEPHQRWWNCLAPRAVAVVTGANRGIGFEEAADPGKILGGAEQHIPPTAARS